MNREIEITIVIPVYNTPDEFLVRCIDSILLQKNVRYEIIIVDDGSEEITKDYVKKVNHENIHIYLNEHHGVSATRNFGITKASGKYIAFVDADDFILPDFLEHAIRIAYDYDEPDIIIGGIEYRPYSKKNHTQFGKTLDVFEGNQVSEIKKSMMHINPLAFDYYILGTPCGRLYKTSIAKRVLFPEKVALCEDQIFNRRSLLTANKVIVVPELWYVYEQNAESVMHTKAKRNFYEMIKPYWDELYLLDSLETMEDMDGLRGFYVRSFYNMLGQYAVNNEYESSYLKQIIDDALVHPLLQVSINKLHMRAKIPIDRKIEWLLMRLHAKKMIILVARLLMKQ